jgi:hypothetical protein
MGHLAAALCLILLAVAPLHRVKQQAEPPVQPTPAGYAQEEILERLGRLAGGRWAAEGAWSNGTAFRQEQAYSWELDSTLIGVATYGAQNTGELAAQSYGIRAWSSAEQRMLFWEFNTSGGITSGRVGADGEEGFFYEYTYAVNGTSRTLRDVWRRIDENTYAFTVGEYDNGSLQTVFLEATFRRKP